MIDTPKRKPGRPAKAPGGPKRASLKIRIHERTRAALEKLAAENGRSLSEEAEHRLDYSLVAQGALAQTLDLSFGRGVSGLLILLGRILQDTGSHAGFASTQTIDGAENWLNDPYAFNQATAAVASIFEELRPEGVAKTPKAGKAFGLDLTVFYANLGASFARTFLGAVAGEEISADLAILGETVRDRLGPAVVERIKRREKEGNRQNG